MARAQSSSVTTIPAGNGPEAIVYDSGKGEFFVVDSSSNSVAIISDASNALVGNITLRLPQVSLSGLAYDSAKSEVFVSYTYRPSGSSQADVMVSAISDSTNNIVANISLGTLPFANLGTTLSLAYDSGKSELFVAIEANDTVGVISDASNTIVGKTIAGQQPYSSTYDSGKGEIFVANSNTVSVISDSSNQVVANVSLGSNEAQQVVYDPSKGEVFVAEGAQIAVISDGSNKIIANISGVGSPEGIAYDPSKGELFVAAGSEAYVISDQSNAVVGTINLNSGSAVGAYHVSYDSSKSEVAFSDFYANTLSVVSDSASVTSSSTTGSTRVSTSTTSSSSPSSSLSISISLGAYLPVIGVVALAVIVTCVPIILMSRKSARSATDAQELG